MTEREPNHELLAERLDKPGPAGDSAIGDDPILTRRDEQKLLDEANRAGPPTLTPHDLGLEPLPTGDGRRTSSAASFGAEAIEIVRRHPIPALLVTIGLVYLLARRRKS